MPREKMQFAFSSGVGLVRLGDKGALVEKNLLGSLISINPGDTKTLFEYFDRNGFLFNVSDTEYEPIDTDKMFELIRRLRTTVDLLSAISDSKNTVYEYYLIPQTVLSKSNSLIL